MVALMAHAMAVFTVLTGGIYRLQGPSGSFIADNNQFDMALLLTMPLVRYLNGDRATYATRLCSCGRGLPLLSSIDGRVLDLIRSPDGRVLPGEMFVSMSMQWPLVHKYQVVQTAPDTLPRPTHPIPSIPSILSNKPLVSPCLCVSVVRITPWRTPSTEPSAATSCAASTPPGRRRR